MLVIFVLTRWIRDPLFDLAGVAGRRRCECRSGGYVAAVATGKVIKNVAIAGGASMIGGFDGRHHDELRSSLCHRGTA